MTGPWAPWGATSDDRTARGYLHHSTRLLNTFNRLAAMLKRPSAATAAPESQATIWSPEELEWSKRMHEGRGQEDEDIHAWQRHQAANDPAFRAHILAASADTQDEGRFFGAPIERSLQLLCVAGRLPSRSSRSRDCELRSP